MGIGRFLAFLLIPSGLTTACLVAPDKALAVTQYKASKTPFVFDLAEFNPSILLTVQDTAEVVRMSEQTLTSRLTQSAKDDTVEPLTVTVSEDESDAAAMAEKIAKPGHEDELTAYLRREAQKTKTAKAGAIRTIAITPEVFHLVDKEAFSSLYGKVHHSLKVDAGALSKSRVLRGEFLRQLAPFFSKEERRALRAKFAKGEQVDVDHELLPEFARNMVKKFIIHRGPNCFHAALAFQSPVMTSSSLINVKKETGYHRAMINYDELWRILGQAFYEVDATKQQLKYGDMLVFFDVPKGEAPGADIDFRWIRHTATYLFSGYTFSKGSKSPNTPYTVRTVAEEWKTWKHFTQNLGVKVFRRSARHARVSPPLDLTDWVY